MSDQADYTKLAAHIASAFVSHNTIRASEMPELIATIHASLASIAVSKPAEEPVSELKPAVSIKKSVTDDYLICLDDGKKFQSLKRNLAVLGMTPGEYRAKWGLPRDYPMVAPSYAATRSALAKANGLGNSRQKAALEIQDVPAPAKRRGRPKKAA